MRHEEPGGYAALRAIVGNLSHLDFTDGPAGSIGVKMAPAELQILPSDGKYYIHRLGGMYRRRGQEHGTVTSGNVDTYNNKAAARTNCPLE